MRLKSSKVCTKKNLCVNKSSFQIFHSATLQDFFDGPMYVITSKEWNICTCTHAIHLSISISSCRLENQMNGVQREEGQLAICSSKDRSFRGCSIYETHAPLFLFEYNNKVHGQCQRKCKQRVKYCWRKPPMFEDGPHYTF